MKQAPRLDSVSPTAASDAPSQPRRPWRGTESDRWRTQVQRLSLGRIEDQSDKDRMVRCLETALTDTTVGRPISGSPCISVNDLLALHLLFHFTLKRSIACATTRPPDARLVRVRWHGLLCKVLQAWRMNGQCSTPTQPPCKRHRPIHSSISARVCLITGPASSTRMCSSASSGKEGTIATSPTD
jgi:hypothetical protein